MGKKYYVKFIYKCWYYRCVKTIKFYTDKDATNFLNHNKFEFIAWITEPINKKGEYSYVY